MAEQVLIEVRPFEKLLPSRKWSLMVEVQREVGHPGVTRGSQVSQTRQFAPRLDSGSASLPSFLAGQPCWCELPATTRGLGRS